MLEVAKICSWKRSGWHEVVHTPCRSTCKARLSPSPRRKFWGRKFMPGRTSYSNTGWKFEAGRFPHRFCTTGVSESLCSSLRCYFPRTTAFLRKTNLLLYLLGEKPGRKKKVAGRHPTYCRLAPMVHSFFLFRFSIFSVFSGTSSLRHHVFQKGTVVVGCVFVTPTGLPADRSGFPHLCPGALHS